MEELLLEHTQKELEQTMKATVNLNQILQGGLAGLVAWLLKLSTICNKKSQHLKL